MKRKMILCVCMILTAITISQAASANSDIMAPPGNMPPPGTSNSKGHQKGNNENKIILDELKIYIDKVNSNKEEKQVFNILTNEEVARIQTLLLNQFMPFSLTEELLNQDTTLYGKTNVKGLNVREKQSTSSEKICAIPISGTVLLITEDMSNGWYNINVFEKGKEYTGYVKSEMIDLIEKPEYFIGLCEKLLIKAPNR